jgi:hypothetical protein
MSQSFQNVSSHSAPTQQVPKSVSSKPEYSDRWVLGSMDRLTFRQYIPLKAAKFCIKMYELCESSSSYIWSSVTYTGRDMELMNQFVSAETNKTVANVESCQNTFLVMDTLCGWIVFIIHQLALFMRGASQCPTHYSPAGNGDMLDIVVHHNIRVSDVIVRYFGLRSPTNKNRQTGSCQN